MEHRSNESNKRIFCDFFLRHSWLLLMAIARSRLNGEVMQPLLEAARTRQEQGGADEASLYADGTRAIDENRWPDAVGLFDRVAQMHGEHAEGALYWKAYAENKEGQQANALSTCGELRKSYPKSRWLDECGALEIEIRGKSGQPVSPQAETDENLKLLALNALMQQDQEQAVPILYPEDPERQPVGRGAEEPGAVCARAESVAAGRGADPARSPRASPGLLCRSRRFA